MFRSFIQEHNRLKRDYILMPCLFMLVIIAICMFTRFNLIEAYADWASYDDLTDTGKAQANWGATIHINGNGASKADCHWKYYIDTEGRGNLRDGLPPANLTVTENHGKYYSNRGGSQTGWWFESTGYAFSFKCDTVGLTPVIQLDIPEREGYNFKGWTISGAMGQWDFIYLKFVEVGYGSWADITCTANWEPISRTITIHGNNLNKLTYDGNSNSWVSFNPYLGGEPTFDGPSGRSHVSVDYNGAYCPDARGPSAYGINAPPGYFFDHWEVSWDGGNTWQDNRYVNAGKWYGSMDLTGWTTNIQTNNVHYRAIWRYGNVVRLNANGGTNINEQGQAQPNNFELVFMGLRPTYGETWFNDMKLRATRTGYDFAGWYNDPNGGEMVWDTNGYAVQDNGSCNYWAGGGSRKWNELKWNLYCDWENMRWHYGNPDHQPYFYAHWNPHHYWMVSNVNTPAEAHTAATGGWKPVITTYDDTNYGTAALASCPGYTFLGWFTAGGEMIYNAQGQRCTNNSVFDNRGAWRWAGGNGKTLNLYAHWSNNPPANEWFKATELGTNNVWWANINNNNPANQGAITDIAKWSNKGYNFRLRGNDVGDGIRFAGILNENDCWFTSWNGNVTAGEWTKDITDDGIYSQVYGHVKDSAGQWRNTGAFKVYIDRQAPKINTFNVKIGAQKNLMPNADMTAIGSHPAVGNVYKDYDSTPYGSWVNVRISDANNSIKPIRGGSGAVSGINTVQVKVYDIKNPSHNKVYTLAQNPGINYEYSGILDTISDFPEVMELGYELTVTDYAGNTSTSDTKSTSRGIEVYSSIEKVDTDINGDSSFVCGTRGIVHVFTTGWVDNVSVQFPDSFNKAWAYDEARGVPKPSLTPINYHTYGRNGFIRCWDIEFWIPMSLINPDNPDHITVDPNGSLNWPINVIGHDEYPYINVNLPGGTPGHGGSTPDATINVPSIPGNNKSILDQFRTIIKQDN